MWISSLPRLIWIERNPPPPFLTEIMHVPSGSWSDPWCWQVALPCSTCDLLAGCAIPVLASPRLVDRRWKKVNHWVSASRFPSSSVLKCGVGVHWFRCPQKQETTLCVCLTSSIHSSNKVFSLAKTINLFFHTTTRSVFKSFHVYKNTIWAFRMHLLNVYSLHNRYKRHFWTCLDV